MAMILILGFVFCVGIIAVVVDWRKMLREHYANNPEKAVIYIKCGSDVVKMKGKRIYPSDDGDLYVYRRAGKRAVVAVPFEYPYEFIEGRRMIGVLDGEATASPFNIGDVRGEGVCDVSGLVLGNTLVKLIEALTGKGQPPWLWIVVVVGVALVGYVVYQFFMGGAVAPVVPVPPPGGWEGQ